MIDRAAFSIELQAIKLTNSGANGFSVKDVFSPFKTQNKQKKAFTCQLALGNSVRTLQQLLSVALFDVNKSSMWVDIINVLYEANDSVFQFPKSNLKFLLKCTFINHSIIVSIAIRSLSTERKSVLKNENFMSNYVDGKKTKKQSISTVFDGNPRVGKSLLINNFQTKCFKRQSSISD